MQNTPKLKNDKIPRTVLLGTSFTAALLSVYYFTSSTTTPSSTEVTNLIETPVSEAISA